MEKMTKCLLMSARTAKLLFLGERYLYLTEVL